MCFIRSKDSSPIPMYYHKRNKNWTEVFTHTFLNLDGSRNLTILKYISRSNPNIPFLTSKPTKIININIKLKETKNKNVYSYFS
jgi:hypothetical protein